MAKEPIAGKAAINMLANSRIILFMAKAPLSQARAANTLGNGRPTRCTDRVHVMTKMEKFLHKESFRMGD